MDLEARVTYFKEAMFVEGYVCVTAITAVNNVMPHTVCGTVLPLPVYTL